MGAVIFKRLVAATIDKLKVVAISNPTIITSCKSGDDFELRVVDAVTAVLSDLKIAGKVHHTPGSHGFPDIVIEFEDGGKYGIEVKSSSASKSKGWKINGNSVMGSTRTLMSLKPISFLARRPCLILKPVNMKTV